MALDAKTLALLRQISEARYQSTSAELRGTRAAIDALEAQRSALVTRGREPGADMRLMAAWCSWTQSKRSELAAHADDHRDLLPAQMDATRKAFGMKRAVELLERERIKAQRREAERKG